MPTRETLHQVLSAKIDPERWLVLELRGSSNWTLQIVGPEPLTSDFVEISVIAAQSHAGKLAEKHLKQANARAIVPPHLRWREAIRIEQAA